MSAVIITKTSDDVQLKVLVPDGVLRVLEEGGLLAAAIVEGDNIRVRLANMVRTSEAPDLKEIVTKKI